MNGKATLPIGFAALGMVLLAVGWISGLGLTGAGIGCILGGLLTLAWRVGRHYECG